MYVCMYVCMYVIIMYVCLYVCMYVCITFKHQVIYCNNVCYTATLCIPRKCFHTPSPWLLVWAGVGIMLDPSPETPLRALKYTTRGIHHIFSAASVDAKLNVMNEKLFHADSREAIEQQAREARESGVGAYGEEEAGEKAVVLSARCGSADATGNTIADRVTGINYGLLLDAPAAERKAVVAAKLGRKAGRLMERCVVESKALQRLRAAASNVNIDVHVQLVNMLDEDE